MAPTNVVLVEDNEKGECALRWKKPRHDKKQNLLNYSVVSKQKSSDDVIPIKGM